MSPHRYEALTYLCRQLDLAADIGPRTWRMFLEKTPAIESEATVARLRQGEITIVLWDGVALRRDQQSARWRYRGAGDVASTEGESR